MKTCLVSAECGKGGSTGGVGGKWKEIFEEKAPINMEKICLLRHGHAQRRVSVTCADASGAIRSKECSSHNNKKMGKKSHSEIATEENETIRIR